MERTLASATAILCVLAVLVPKSAAAEVLSPDELRGPGPIGQDTPPPRCHAVRMGSDYPYEAKRRVEALIETLEPLVAKDSEQEIRGIAVPVFEATLDVLKEALPDDPVVQKVIGAYELEFETGEPVRAVDALLVARQVDAGIGPYPIAIA